jgi:uncharacterized protein
MTTLRDIKKILSAHKPEFADRFGVKNLGIFGSYARGDQGPDSDVDLLVEFHVPVGIEFIDLGDYLERILNLKVDLVSRNGIKARYLSKIEPDLQYV